MVSLVDENSEELLRNIWRCSEKNNYKSINKSIFNSTPGISHKYQTSQIIRYVVIYYNEDCKGQDYDNDAIMAEKHTGVQTHIKEINPNAELVAYINHFLNLACVQVASAAVGFITFSELVLVFNFFQSSMFYFLAKALNTVRKLAEALEQKW